MICVGSQPHLNCHTTAYVELKHAIKDPVFKECATKVGFDPITSKKRPKNKTTIPLFLFYF
jgi:hypothetical protein